MQEVDKGVDAKNVNTGCKKPKPRNVVSVLPTIFEFCESQKNVSNRKCQNYSPFLLLVLCTESD